MRISPFSRENPEWWFLQVENQFSLSNIVSEETKYLHLTGFLDENVATEVLSLVMKPPTDKPYSKLKEALLARFSISKEKKINMLLNCEEMGNRKPSTFLTYIKSLADADTGESIIKAIWVTRLPQHIRVAIAGQSVKATLESLARVADEVYEISPGPALPTSTAHLHPTAHAAPAVDLLSERFSNILSTFGRRRERSPNRRSGRNSSPNFPEMCWYHEKFGKNARKCEPPCVAQQGNLQGGR